MRTAIRCLAAASGLSLLLFHVPATAQTQPVPDAKTWVKEHDKNRDGTLDREEFYQAAVESFYFRDRNKRGYLVIEELPDASREALKAMKLKADGRISLQEYINALFKDFDAADTDHDGLLTVEEIDVYIKKGK
jgi:Ca2+-binding EF-hand superfamily protein